MPLGCATGLKGDPVVVGDLTEDYSGKVSYGSTEELYPSLLYLVHIVDLLIDQFT